MSRAEVFDRNRSLLFSIAFLVLLESLTLLELLSDEVTLDSHQGHQARREPREAR